MAGTTTTSNEMGLGLAGADRDTTIQHNKLVDDVAVFTPLTIQTTQVANTSTTETDLMTYALAAAKLANVGDGVRIHAWGTTANNANTKTLKGYFGAGVYLNLALTASQAGRWELYVSVIKTGSSTQKIIAELNEGTVSLAAGKIALISTTGSETDTAAITIKCTGTSGTASSDITQEGLVIEFLNVASDLTAAKVGNLTGTAITT